MAKDRVIQCIHYQNAGNCDLGKKDCYFWGLMQTCATYKPKAGSKPIRTDNRQKKLAKIRNKEAGR